MKYSPTGLTPHTQESRYDEGWSGLLRQGETNHPTVLPSLQEATYSQRHNPVPEDEPFPDASTYGQKVYPAAANQFLYPLQMRRKRSLVGLVLGILLYLVGGFIAAFGLTGMLQVTKNPTLAGAGFLILCVLALQALTIILMRHRYPRLRGWFRIVLLVGITIPALLIFPVVFANSPAHQPATQAESLVLGITCFLSGIGMAIIALL